MSENYKHYCKRAFDVDVIIFVNDIFDIDRSDFDKFMDQNLDLSNGLTEDEFLDFCCLDIVDLYRFKF